METYQINGYWNNDNTPIQGYTVTEWDCIPQGYKEEVIFYYGLSLPWLLKELKEKGECEVGDFTVTEVIN